jgi:hypothetical protein
VMLYFAPGSVLLQSWLRGPYSPEVLRYVVVTLEILRLRGPRTDLYGFAKRIACA